MRKFFWLGRCAGEYLTLARCLLLFVHREADCSTSYFFRWIRKLIRIRCCFCSWMFLFQTGSKISLRYDFKLLEVWKSPLFSVSVRTVSTLVGQISPQPTGYPNPKVDRRQGSSATFGFEVGGWWRLGVWGEIWVFPKIGGKPPKWMVYL